MSLNSAQSFINSPFIKIMSITQFEWCHLFPARTLIDTISNQENTNEIVSLRRIFCLNSFSYPEVLNSHKFKLLKGKIPIDFSKLFQIASHSMSFALTSMPSAFNQGSIQETVICYLHSCILNKCTVENSVHYCGQYLWHGDGKSIRFGGKRYRL